jgi:two-component system chemotaxis response regulator CheY
MQTARVLVVDDSAVMRKIVVRSLRQAGLEMTEVFEAGNGSEALAVAQEHPALDLILSDINMPVMDGVEFVRKLRGMESAQHIPVIMVTTEAGEARVVQALSSGASGYIRKPFTPEQIEQRVMPLLKG